MITPSLPSIMHRVVQTVTLSSNCVRFLSSSKVLHLTYNSCSNGGIHAQTQRQRNNVSFLRKNDSTSHVATSLGNFCKVSKLLDNHKVFCRNLSTAPADCHPAFPAQVVDTLIETWFYTVAPRGSIVIDLPFKTIVRPLNPQDHPDMDKVILELHFDKTCSHNTPQAHELSQISDLYNLNVAFEKDVAQMNVTGNIVPGVDLSLVCILWIPLQSDLTASVSSNKDLTVEKLESNTVNLTAESGSCFLKSLKCGSVNVQCKAGDINSKSTVLGNVIFHTGGTGEINADKLQGSSVVCETEMGSVAVKSLYTESAIVRTTAGHVNLGQCHGQLLMQSGQSDITVESLEGDIDVGTHSGNVKVHLSRHTKSNIDVKNGNISLSFPEGVNTDLSLDSGSINVDEAVNLHITETDIPHHMEGSIGESGRSAVHARTLSGAIDIKLLDWIQTTKLAFKKE